MRVAKVRLMPLELLGLSNAPQNQHETRVPKVGYGEGVIQFWSNLSPVEQIHLNNHKVPMAGGVSQKRVKFCCSRYIQGHHDPIKESV